MSPRRSLLPALLLLLSACAPPELRPEVPVDEDLVELQGAFHVHLDPSKAFEDNYLDLQSGWAAGMLDFIVLIDDGLSPDRARELFESKDGTVIIPAVELENGLLAVGLRRPLPPRADADEIRRRGGIAILRAPKGAAWDAAGADGVELYDLEETVGRRVPDVDSWRKAIDVRRGTEVVAELDDDVIRRWDALNRERRLLGLASHGTHHGNNARLSFQEAFQLVTVHVNARNRSREAILEAFRKRDCTVFFDALNGYNKSSVFVEAKDGEARLIIAWSNALEAEHHIFLDGSPVRLETARMIGFGLSYAHHFILEKPGLYRVRADLEKGGRWRPWYLTNPVRAIAR
jgi:hypothetical protein